MKNYLIIVPVAILMSFSSCQVVEEETKEQNEIVGVYQYTDNIEGMSVMTEKYFIMLARYKAGSLPYDSLDIQTKYNSLSIHAGKWTLQDSIITCNILFDKNPAAIGTSFRFKYKTDGDKIISYILGPNDEVVGTSSSIRLE